MARPGPKPTPTAVLAMRGSWRAGTRKGEIMPSGDLPTDAPPWLTDGAATIYRRMAENQGIRSILTSADCFTLALYASVIEVIADAHAALERDGLTTEGSTGQSVLHPAARLLMEAMDRALAAARELGLTPASRVGITTVTPGKPIPSYFAP